MRISPESEPDRAVCGEPDAARHIVRPAREKRASAAQHAEEPPEELPLVPASEADDADSLDAPGMAALAEGTAATARRPSWSCLLGVPEAMKETTADEPVLRLSKLKPWERARLEPAGDCRKQKFSQAI